MTDRDNLSAFGVGFRLAISGEIRRHAPGADTPTDHIAVISGLC